MPYRFFRQYSSKAICALVGYSVGLGSSYLFTHFIEKRDKTKLSLFEPRKLPVDYDYLAPDTSEIRRLQTNIHSGHGDIAHCKLPVQSTSIAIKHKTVEEIWYVTHGIGEMWLKERNGSEHVFKIEKNMALTIQKGASFQFRNISEIEPLEIIITSMPPWPGPEEVIQVQGKWEPSLQQENHRMTYKK